MKPTSNAAAQHPRHRLSETLHQPVRFSIVAALAATESMDFGTLRDRIQVSDSVLSKQVTILEQAEIVQVKKGFVGKRPRTWLALSKAGRLAWDAHLATIREIAGAAGGIGTSTPVPAGDQSVE